MFILADADGPCVIISSLRDEESVKGESQKTCHSNNDQNDETLIALRTEDAH